MATPLSEDLRQRIVAAIESGSSRRAAAARFAVSPASAVRLMQRVQRTGSLAPGQIGGHRRPLLEPHEATLRAIVDEKPDLTLAEIRAELMRRLGLAVGLTAIHTTLWRLGLRVKKKSLTAAEQDRPDVARHRCRWRVWQRFMDSTRLVFLDETAATTSMVRLYGRAPKGERLVGGVPQGHWATTTVVAGLRQSGIIAPLVLAGPMTGPLFKGYVEQALAPCLEPDDVVVMDNVSVHKVAGVAEAIRAAGASLLYLPPYSPDLNPIEQVFAKLKALLRKAAARTKETLWTAIGASLDAFTPGELQNYLAHCGYDPN